MEMKHLPIGVYTFSDFIKDNYIYVDKTKDIYNLFATGGKYYFLSRPRRFGKSLLVSTLKEIFSGNKELFKGLWIYDKIKWETYPVIHIDFLGLNYTSTGELIDTLHYLVRQNAQYHKVKLEEKTYDKQFRELVKKLSQKNKVVVLVDEYDKPIIDFVDQKEIALENRNILKSFYGNLKGLDEYLKFVFITGVSKFSKVSVFSDLNNLDDITLDKKYTTMLGYTHEELSRYFDYWLDKLEIEFKKEKKYILEDIKQWYNGYSWDGENFVYTPHSVLNLFKKERFDNYWFASATPTFLIKQIQTFHTPVEKLENYESDGTIFESYDVDRMNVISLLFQTGYLTIKKVDEISLTTRMYYFSYPNMEVKESFLKHLFSEFSRTVTDQVGGLVLRLSRKLDADDLEGFFEILEALFASIPYDIFVKEREGYYSTIIYLLLTLIGIKIKTEVHTSRGRIDAVIETEDNIYIMEYKLGTADQALDQVKEKKYYEKFLISKKGIKLIGIGFDVEKKNIRDYKIEALQR
jgi:hypothetical protein